MSSLPQTKKSWKLVTQLIGGGVVGAAAAFLFFSAVKGSVDLDDPGRVAAVLAGLIYLIIGLVVGFGTLSPAAGAHFLNVEDADEIREERANIASSALASVLTGTFFIVLALAQSPQGAGLLDRETALAIAGACLLLSFPATLLAVRRTDELFRQVGREAGALTLNTRWSYSRFGQRSRILAMQLGSTRSC